MADIIEQQNYEQEYSNRIAEWDLISVGMICKELGKIGKMTPEQAKKYDAEKQAKKIEKAIIGALATTILLNIKSLSKTYKSILDGVFKESEYLYKYRGVIADDKIPQKIIKQYAKKSGADFIEFAKTKAIKVLDGQNPVALRSHILKSFNEASNIVIDGKADFYTSMRKSVLELGGSGMRVEYPNGLTRRLDTVVRQNMLYNGKMASAEYSRKIGEELNCDGIEITFSVNPRPSHRFMEGKQYAKYHTKKVNGVLYEGAEDKGVYDRLYEDYNCHHREIPIILGISEPTYTPEELARLKAENEKQYTIGKSTGDGYFWSQRMRQLETETRRAKDQIYALKSFGNSETEIAELNQKINMYKSKYDEICNVTGIVPEYNRMRIFSPLDK